MTSIKEVAQLAQVSIATVSNTLNRPELVLPSTRQRVDAAIAELGFIPNQHARQLSGLSSQVLGLIVIDAANPFFMEVARSVEQTAADADHVIISCNSGGDVATERKFMRLLAGQRVRGILLTPASTDHLDASLARSTTPLVLLDHPAAPGSCSVSVDDFHGGRLAAEHLLDLGHAGIVFVGGPDTIRQHRDRYQGAVAAVSERGLDPETVLARVQTAAIDTAAGATAVPGVLALGHQPTAIMCGNDVLAFGVYRGLAHAGLSVPEDVSLVGYDDVDVAADWVVPLTSVRQPAADLGRAATRLLFEHSAGAADHHHEQILFQPSLAARVSTAPPRP